MNFLNASSVYLVKHRKKDYIHSFIILVPILLPSTPRVAPSRPSLPVPPPPSLPPVLPPPSFHPSFHPSFPPSLLTSPPRSLPPPRSLRRPGGPAGWPGRVAPPSRQDEASEKIVQYQGDGRVRLHVASERARDSDGGKHGRRCNDGHGEGVSGSDGQKTGNTAGGSVSGSTQDEAQYFGATRHADDRRAHEPQGVGSVGSVGGLRRHPVRRGEDDDADGLHCTVGCEAAGHRAHAGTPHRWPLTRVARRHRSSRPSTSVTAFRRGWARLTSGRRTSPILPSWRTS